MVLSDAHHHYASMHITYIFLHVTSYAWEEPKKTLTKACPAFCCGNPHALFLSLESTSLGPSHSKLLPTGLTVF